MTNITPYIFKDHPVRTVAINGEPWFVAKDVCDILELSNSRKAILSLDDDERGSVTISDGTDGNPNHSTVNESGLYTLIFKRKSHNEWDMGRDFSIEKKTLGNLNYEDTVKYLYKKINSASWVHQSEES